MTFNRIKHTHTHTLSWRTFLQQNKRKAGKASNHLSHGIHSLLQQFDGAICLFIILKSPSHRKNNNIIYETLSGIYHCICILNEILCLLRWCTPCAHSSQQFSGSESFQTMSIWPRHKRNCFFFSFCVSGIMPIWSIPFMLPLFLSCHGNFYCISVAVLCVCVCVCACTVCVVYVIVFYRFHCHCHWCMSIESN